VALRMGTTRSAISRLEGSRKHLPALSTLRRYADVLGCDVEITLVPRLDSVPTAPPPRGSR
jgi:transcriptional regulator with XRE-family HTH domain